MILCGGKKQDANIYRLNLRNNIWTAYKTDSENVMYCFRPTVWIDCNYLYFFGGSGLVNTKSCVEIKKLSFDTLKWQIINTFGDKPSGSILMKEMKRVLHNTQIFVSFKSNFSHFYTLDLKTYHWSILRVYNSHLIPNLYYGFTMVKAFNSILLFGGYSKERMLLGMKPGITDLYMLDLNTLCWTKFPASKNSPPPLIFHSIAVCGESAFLFCGRDITDFDNEFETNDVYKLNLITLCKPSIRDKFIDTHFQFTQ